MGKNKNIIIYLLAAVGIVFLLSLSVKFKKEKPNPVEKTGYDLKYILSTKNNSVATGDNFEVYLYLKGNDAAKVSAYDFKLYFDPDKLKLNSATPGNFIEKYMTIKWDLQNPWFAIAMSPSSKDKVALPEQPVAIFEFAALDKSGNFTISTANSTVYLANTGGAAPETATLEIKIN